MTAISCDLFWFGRRKPTIQWPFHDADRFLTGIDGIVHWPFDILTVLLRRNHSFRDDSIPHSVDIILLGIVPQFTMLMCLHWKLRLNLPFVVDCGNCLTGAVIRVNRAVHYYWFTFVGRLHYVCSSDERTWLLVSERTACDCCSLPYCDIVFTDTVVTIMMFLRWPDDTDTFVDDAIVIRCCYYSFDVVVPSSFWLIRPYWHSPILFIVPMLWGDCSHPICSPIPIRVVYSFW